MSGRKKLCQNRNRPYAMTSSPRVTKRDTDSERKPAYYAAILSGKNDRGLWNLDQFVSSFLTSAESDFTFTHRMHKISTGPNAHQSEQAYLHASLTQ